MLKYEIKKSLNKYSLFGVLFVLILTVLQVLMQYNAGIAIGMINSIYHFKGSEYIERNKEIADSFSGRMMDDDFFMDFDTAVLRSIESDENGNFNAKGSLQMSSLYQFYGALRTDEYLSLGVLSTDMDSVFGDNKPIFYYTDNWKVMRNIISSIQLIIIFTGGIIASPLFSKEYSDGMTQIIHTMHHGRRKFALVKFASAFIQITLLYVVIIGIIVISVGAIWGFHNPAADIRVMTDAAYISMNEPISCAQLILFQIFVGYFAAVAVTAVGVLFSSAINRTNVTLVSCFAFIILPALLPVGKIDSETVKKFVTLMPVNSINLLTPNWAVHDYNTDVIWLYGAVVLLLTIICCVMSAYFYVRHKIA